MTSRNMEIVIDLAGQGVLEERDCDGEPELLEQRAEQEEAIRVIPLVEAE